MIVIIIADINLRIFTVSAYNKDYAFTKAKDFATALDTVSKPGYNHLIDQEHNNLRYVFRPQESRWSILQQKMTRPENLVLTNSENQIIIAYTSHA